jgi:hypothetical protein
MKIGKVSTQILGVNFMLEVLTAAFTAAFFWLCFGKFK